MRKRRNSISKAKSYKEIGEFWDTHDLDDYWEQTRPVEFEIDIQSEAVYPHKKKDSLLLKNHFDAVENQLLATSQVSANSGHTLHKGTPREAFIKTFLKKHLSEKLEIGTGEIIDCNSTSGQKRNQIDVVIYKREYPKLDFGGGISGFLAESVVATIEVKSKLTESEIKKAVNTAQTVKRLNQSFLGGGWSRGWEPPAILNFVVAYQGPAKMKTVHAWITRAYKSESIQYPVLEPSGSQRVKVASPALDAIFVLGKGFILFDNLPLSFITDQQRKTQPDLRWTITEISHGSLLMLFLILSQAIVGTWNRVFDPYRYVSGFQIDNLTYMP